MSDITGIRIILTSTLILFLSSNFIYAQQTMSASEIQSVKDEVWQVVEKRNSTWVENDFEGHMAIYHPEFRRWTIRSKILMTKELFASFWDGIKDNEEVIKIDIEKKEMQILMDGTLAIAHYIIHEDYKWLSDTSIVRNGKTLEKGQVIHGKLRFSDIYTKENGQWLYVGGHRDGAMLAED